MDQSQNISSYLVKAAVDKEPCHERGWVNFSNEGKVWRRLLQASRAGNESLYLINAIEGGTFQDHIHPGVEWAYMLGGHMEISEPACTVKPHEFVWVKPGSAHSNTTVTPGARLLVYNQSGINWLDEKGQLQLFTTDMMIKKYYQYFEQHGMDKALLDSVIQS